MAWVFSIIQDSAGFGGFVSPSAGVFSIIEVAGVVLSVLAVHSEGYFLLLWEGEREGSIVSIYIMPFFYYSVTFCYVPDACQSR